MGGFFALSTMEDFVAGLGFAMECLKDNPIRLKTFLKICLTWRFDRNRPYPESGTDCNLFCQQRKLGGFLF